MPELTPEEVDALVAQLKELPDADRIAIANAVTPLITVDQIDQVEAALAEAKAAVDAAGKTCDTCGQDLPMDAAAHEAVAAKAAAMDEVASLRLAYRAQEEAAGRRAGVGGDAVMVPDTDTEEGV